MKKYQQLYWLIAVVLLIGCIDRTTSSPNIPDPSTPTPSPTSTPSETAEPSADVLEQAKIVVDLLSNRDMDLLAEAFVHPVKGVRFSPYAYVEQSHIVLMPHQFLPEDFDTLMSDPTVYRWGVYDGDNGFIDQPFSYYFDEFVYDEDYLNAEQIAVNERLRGGTMMDNSREFYENGTTVEFHFPGFDPEFGGLDWVSLRLVFETYQGEWKLVGIIHDQWTT